MGAPDERCACQATRDDAGASALSSNLRRLLALALPVVAISRLGGQPDRSVRSAVRPIAPALHDFEEEALRKRARHQMKVLTVGVAIVKNAKLLQPREQP